MKGALKVVRIGGATLILGDSLAIAAQLPRPAAVVSDPPYGQGYVHGGGVMRTGEYRGRDTARAKSRPIVGDDAPFDPAPWLDAAPIVLLWGAHKFAPRLPDGAWLMWDKRPNGVVRDQGCGEAAWLNRPGPMRIFRHLWDGICVADRSDLADGGRKHPTQKPVRVMRWSIERARVPAGGVVLDPYMGSGSTGIAALQMGFPFVGIEIDPAHFAVACGRIKRAHAALSAGMAEAGR